MPAASAEVTLPPQKPTDAVEELRKNPRTMCKRLAPFRSMLLAACAGSNGRKQGPPRKTKTELFSIRTAGDGSRRLLRCRSL
jgi:hypothetical protein